LSRTILTSGLTFLTAVSLWLFGGQVLNGFSFALVIGIMVGTYSSIFVACPILIYWYDLAANRRKQQGSTATVTSPKVVTPAAAAKLPAAKEAPAKVKRAR
jgi:preprotein translocase subunit SecF